MNLLLDTHAYIWFSANSPQLSQVAKNLIEATGNQTFLSIASLWEMSIKVSLGKLSIDLDFKDVLDDLSDSGIKVLPISFDHILKNRSISFHHRDPFDRMIVAQSIGEGMKLLSTDTVFDLYTNNRVW